MAGSCGLGAIDAAKEKSMQAIGVDADQSYLGPQIITSALKKVDVAVFDAIKSVQDDTYKGGGDVIASLKTNGVGIGKISAAGQKYADQVKRPAADPRRDDHAPGHGRQRDVGRGDLTRPPMDAALELRGITKRFGRIVANDGVDLDLRAGEVHALLGENGAGKSTLMSILYGLSRRTRARCCVRGEPVRFDSPRRAIALGIGMVHQHFMLFPVMTVAENIVLARRAAAAGGLLDVQAAARACASCRERFGLAVDPDALIEDVSVGVQQRVEILKALYRERAVLILDEPTAVLTAAGDAGPVPRAPRAAGRRQGDRLHHAQARRGARDRRPRHGAAARQAVDTVADRRRRPRSRSPA